VAEVLPSQPITGIAFCCARPASGQAVAAAFSTHIELGPRDDRFSMPELIRSR
jgi:hypothetical protein